MTTEETKIKRFYKTASIESGDNGAEILLDGRAAKTPGRKPLLAPTDALGAAIADEWNAQGEFIEPQSMLLTALLSAAVDGVGADDPIDEIVGYLKTDLVCYRAEAPLALVERQCTAWDPMIEWLDEIFGARLIATKGVVAVEQPGAAIDAVRDQLTGQSPALFHGIRTATKITGSAVLGLALWRGEFDSQALFDASRVDEAFQEERWGVDAEAKARTQQLSVEFAAVARFISLL